MRRLHAATGGGATIAAVTILLATLAPPSTAVRRGVAPVRLIEAGQWTGGLFIEGGIADYMIDRAEGDRREKRDLFSPGIQLANRGYLYHPRFVKYSVSGELSWSRLNQSEMNSGFNQRVDGWIDTYALQMLILQERSLHFDLHQDRQSSRVRVTDTRNTDVVDSRRILSAYYRRNNLPIEFRRETGSRETRGLSHSTEKRDLLRLSSRYARSGSHIGELSLSRSRLENRDFGYSTLRYNATLEERLIRDVWTGSLRARWWSLDTGSERSHSTLGSVGARREMAYGFSTEGSIEAERYAGQGRNEDRFDSRINLGHTLFMSLDTDLSLQLAETDPGDGRLKTVDGSLGSSYRKRIPYGRLRLSGSVRRLERESSSAEVDVTVVDLRVRFSSTDDYILPETDVDAGTVVVLDTSGTVVYERDVDYEIDQVGEATVLRRRTSGRIAREDEVRVNYSYNVGGNVTEISNEYLGSSQITTDVGLFARVAGGRRSPAGGTDTDRAEFIRSTNRTIGAGWRRPTWAAEWETSESTGDPLPWKRTRYVGRISGGLSPRLRWALNGNIGWNEFPDQGDRFEFSGGDASLTGLTFITRTALYGRYSRQETETGDLEQWKAGISMQLRLRIGMISVESYHGETHQKISGNERERSLVLRLERRFS